MVLRVKDKWLYIRTVNKKDKRYWIDAKEDDFTDSEWERMKKKYPEIMDKGF